MPVRWLPAEVILEYRFSEKSDIWSFGVLLTELYSKGVIPYSGLSNTMVFERILAGYVMYAHIHIHIHIHTHPAVRTLMCTLVPQSASVYVYVPCCAPWCRSQLVCTCENKKYVQPGGVFTSLVREAARLVYFFRGWESLQQFANSLVPRWEKIKSFLYGDLLCWRV